MFVVRGVSEIIEASFLSSPPMPENSLGSEKKRGDQLTKGTRER